MKIYEILKECHVHFKNTNVRLIFKSSSFIKLYVHVVFFPLEGREMEG